MAETPLQPVHRKIPPRRDRAPHGQGYPPRVIPSALRLLWPVPVGLLCLGALLTGCGGGAQGGGGVSTTANPITKWEGTNGIVYAINQQAADTQCEALQADWPKGASGVTIRRSGSMEDLTLCVAPPGD